jgi:hypothetical protein
MPAKVARGGVAIFDADFIAPAISRRTVPQFADPKVGMVQRAGGTSTADTAAHPRQAILLDGRFARDGSRTAPAASSTAPPASGGPT